MRVRVMVCCVVRVRDEGDMLFGDGDGDVLFGDVDVDVLFGDGDVLW